MTGVARDSSRDRRIEAPTNLYVVHAAAHALLPYALRRRVSANAISLAGLALGAGAATAFYHWRDAYMASLGLLLATLWMICDGLDGMVARATGTASPVGRLLDGLCDHGVFALIYLGLAFSIGTAEGWALALAAAIAHAVQSSFYESERARFHRRLRGDPGNAPAARTGNPLERLYDAAVGLVDRAAAPFDAALARARDPEACGRIYAAAAVAPLRAMIPLSANTRVVVIYLACVRNAPAAFFWFELAALTPVAIVAMAWHRRVEARFAASGAPAAAS